MPDATLTHPVHAAGTGAPPTPTGLTARVFADRRVQLDWASTPDVTWDIHELRTDPANTFKATVSASTSVRGPLRGGVYEYGVVAKNANGSSSMSATVVLRVDPAGGGEVITEPDGGDPDPQTTGDQTMAAVRHGWGAPLAQSDEFGYTGAPKSTKWSLYSGPGHGGNGRRVPERCTVDGEKLVITGLENGDSGGMAHRFDQQYGRWEVRMRASNTTPSGKTYHPVLIIWPTDDRWPESGEYDFCENSSPAADKAQAFIHFPHPDTVEVQQRRFEKQPWDTSAWHNYAIEWTADGITCYLDGEKWFTTSGGAQSSPRRSDIQAMPSGHLTIQLDNFNGSTGNRGARMEIDWVHVYPLTPQGGGGDGDGGDGGDGGGAATFTHPADVFRLGTTGGSWANLGVGLPDDHVDIKPDELARYVKPDYFFLNAARTGAVLKSHMDAATTSSGTHYGRVELRQLTRNKQKAAWKAAGTTFVVEYDLTVDHIQPKKPWATLGQFHDSESDALAIKIKGRDRTSLDWVATFYDEDHPTKLLTGYDATSSNPARVKIRIELKNGICTIFCNGTKKITSEKLKGKSGLYWKCGVYPQAHSKFASGGFSKESPDEYCQVTYYSYEISQDPAP